MGDFFEIGGDGLRSKAARGLPSFRAETRRVAPRDELESVILVDAGNNVIGTCGKLAVHREGRLHRAFSILITNQDGKLLLQRRAACKYHFANRWSNACCGHPRPGESTPAAARRRLAEELGFTVPLKQTAAYTYRARDPVSGLVEHEYLHVFHGVYAGEPWPNPDEVGACRWMPPEGVRRGLAARPDWFTPWFALLTARSRAGDVRLVID
jgi:isopentenyl-diphosphate delta-isomerase